MSDEDTDALDDMMEHAPVEDYSGDDTADAGGITMQPSDAEYTTAGDQTTETGGDSDPAPDPSRDG